MSSEYNAPDWPEELSTPVPIKKAKRATKPKQDDTLKAGPRSCLKPVPKGYRLVDDRHISAHRKAARTRSIKAALTKRDARQPIKIPVWQKGERRAVYAKIMEKKRREKERSEAVTIYGPYDIYPTGGTRAWEVELRKALGWFVDTFGGPETPEETRWRELDEAASVWQDAHFGNAPDHDWDWSWRVPDREEMDRSAFEKAREWSSPRFPPVFMEAVIAALAEAAARREAVSQ